MANVVLPGTYITVCDEGLISAGAVSVGNVGIVGTAPVNKKGKVHLLSSFTEARETFGPQTDKPQDNTLLGALELVFGNGAHNVYAVQLESIAAAKYEEALALLENEIVNIVLLADQDARNSAVMTKLKNHLNTTAGIKRERIGVVGCNGSTNVDDILKAGDTVATQDGRLIYVAPGLKVKKRDPAKDIETEMSLSGAYTAAAVAGLLSSLPVQTSPTNKILNISGLVSEFNHGQLEKLVSDRVLAVEKREGFRVVKGITTSTNPAWSQITTRRIVDKAIYGVRSACNPYIGKLNNTRVRGAMKATIDGFLTRMVDEESLVGYTLEVSATRTQEIAGQCIVTMTIQPTFSIDYIMVTMYLG